MTPAGAPADLKEYVLFTDYLKQSPSGIYDARSPLDGERTAGRRQRISQEAKAAMSALPEQAYLAPDRAELTITGDGQGFTPLGNEAGMGSRLIRAFAQQLGNDYACARENGTRFAIRFPAKL